VSLVHNLLNVYLIVLAGRAVLSWLPLSPNSSLAPVASFLYAVTDAVLAPVRRIIPPIGGFDISFLIVFIVIQVINSRI